MNTFQFSPKTIILTVGPSNCGKSTFSDTLISRLQSQGYSVFYSSSDNNRRKLLNDMTLHKHDPKMMTVSKQAFDLCYAEMDIYTQYPVNTDFIIFDATNLNELSRKPAIDLARKNGYNVVTVVFDYKNAEDYYKFVDKDVNEKVISDMVFSFRKMMKDFKHKDFDKTFTVPKPIDYSNFEVEVTVPEIPVNTAKNVIIVGDVHGCKSALIELINNSEMFLVDETETIQQVVEDSKIILVGDYIDKNTDENIIDTIEFLYKNKQHFNIVRGNHEKHCYDVIKGSIKRTEEEDKLIDSFFTSVKLFDRNEEIKNKFIELYEISYFFLKDADNRFIVTHAPCRNAVLGKVNNKAHKAQNTIMYPKMNEEDINGSLDTREEFFKFLITEANGCFPYHFFGHVALSEVFMHVNKIGLDTGCVYTGVMAGAIFREGNKKPFIKKVKVESDIVSAKTLYPMFRVKQTNKALEEFDYDAAKFIKIAIENKLSFISGTMSPTNKMGEELESLQAGLDYYASKGVKEVMFQPKKMGSRCNVYIYKGKPLETTMISRNGYRIRPKTVNMTIEEFEAVISKVYAKYEYLFDKLDADFVLLDGELLPWNVMANGLIEKDFKLPITLVENENEFLKASGFYDKLKAYKEQDASTLSKFHKDGMDTCDIMKESLSTYNQVKHEVQEYNEQVDWFARKYDVDFSAFMILKYAKGNDETVAITDERFTNFYIYTVLLQNQDYYWYNLETEKGEGMLAGKHFTGTPQDFYTALVDSTMEEGVVIKPSEKAYQPGVAPYLKCRNSNYLRMTYGFDYQRTPKYKLLVDKKNITRKLKTSIEEWELARELLQINRKDLTIDNKKYIYLLSKLHKALESEKQLDPRL